MKILSIAEVKKLTPKQGSWVRSMLRVELEKLKVNDSLFIGKDEWHKELGYKSKPSSCYSVPIFNKSKLWESMLKWKLTQRVYEEGYVITRLK